MSRRSFKKRTTAQNRRMWSLVGDLQRSGLSRDDAEDVLRNAVRAVSGQPSTSALSRSQAAAVIDRLQRQLPAPAEVEASSPDASATTAKRKTRPRRTSTISGRQQEVLQRVFVQAGMGTQAEQMAFTRRQTGKPWPQTQKDFDAIMEALKSMVLRAAKPLEVWGRVQALLEHPKLDHFERVFIPDLHKQFRDAQKAGTLDKVLTTGKLAKLTEAELRCGVTP